MPEAISGRRLGELLSQLCAALGKPFGAKGEKMLPGYLKGLERWPEEAIEWAIWRACATWKAKSFPKPAELADLCAQSPHKKLEPEKPAEPEVNEVERCRDCTEWWGYHRVVMNRGEMPVLLTIQIIRHRGRCRERASLERFMQFYSYSWVDGPPDSGQLEPGGEAWKVPGVLQLISPLPPRPAPAKPKLPSKRIDRRPPTPTADVAPAVQTSTEVIAGG